MIGDWVYNKHHKKNIQITPYDFFTHRHHPSGRQYFIGEPELVSGRDLEPIPLTPEILEKNGFSENYRAHDLSYAQSCGDVIGIHIYGTNGLMEEMYFKYVHELQHALRLCGIEKEIKL